MPIIFNFSYIKITAGRMGRNKRYFGADLITVRLLVAQRKKSKNSAGVTVSIGLICYAIVF